MLRLARSQDYGIETHLRGRSIRVFDEVTNAELAECFAPTTTLVPNEKYTVKPYFCWRQFCQT
jgi:hypothetical protein